MAATSVRGGFSSDSASYDAAEIQQFRCWCFSQTLYSQTFTKSSLLLYRPRAFGGIAPPKSSSGDQNWFPSHYKSKILVKYTVRIFFTNTGDQN